MAGIPTLDPSVMRGIADELGATDSGLTNREIDELLSVAKIQDVTPKPSNPYVYYAISKRDRLYNCLVSRQQRDGVANGVLHFLECVMKPARFTHDPGRFASWRTALNESLAFAALHISAEGKVGKTARAAKTLSQAQARSLHLRKLLVERHAHPRILLACASEIDDDNYFHAVLEAAKSLAAEIRFRTGLTADGALLIDQSFEKGQRPYPRLACNSLQTETEWSEQRGLANLLRGVLGAFRNPVAHELKVTWRLSEQDALDALSLMSLLHRKLDSSVVTPDPK